MESRDHPHPHQSHPLLDPHPYFLPPSSTILYIHRVLYQPLRTPTSGRHFPADRIFPTSKAGRYTHILRVSLCYNPGEPQRRNKHTKRPSNYHHITPLSRNLHIHNFRQPLPGHKHPSHYLVNSPPSVPEDPGSIPGRLNATANIQYPVHGDARRKRKNENAKVLSSFASPNSMIFPLIFTGI